MHADACSWAFIVIDFNFQNCLCFISFMGKHLGGKIHVTNYCYNSEKLPKGIVTYRPTILEHFGGSRNKFDKQSPTR